jgi:hypothetical protein
MTKRKRRKTIQSPKENDRPAEAIKTL